MKRWLAALALAFSGAVQALISPPLNLWWIHPVALAPGLFVLLQLSGRRAFLAGWLQGFCANLAIFSWLPATVHNFAQLSWVIASALWFVFCAVYSLYMGVFAWGLSWLRRENSRWLIPLIAAWFVACEFLNPQLFPYYQGVAWYQVPSVFLVSSYAGVPAVSFLIVFCNLLVVTLVVRRGAFTQEQRVVAWGAFSVCLAGALFLASFRSKQIAHAEEGAPRLKVALVQANFDVDEIKTLKSESYMQLAEAHVGLSREALSKHPDIDVFVYPEGALAGRPDARGHESLRKFARDNQVEVWTGASNKIFEKTGLRRYNSAWQLTGDAEVFGPYNKIHLLPFGEYIPGRDTLPVLKRYQIGGNILAGSEQRIFTGPKKIRFCFLICYEITLPHAVKAVTELGLDGVNSSRSGPDLIVNLTYDAWFGNSSCLAQHLMLAAIPAAQLGVPVIRAATTGISAVVDARGQLIAQTEPWTETVLVQELAVAQVPSWYARWGNWFAWLCTALSVGALGLSWARFRRGRPADFAELRV